jgi:hypothetical protein
MDCYWRPGHWLFHRQQYCRRLNTSGTGQVSVTESNGFGCDSSASRSVTVGQSATPQINGPVTVCAYDVATLYNPTSPQYQLHWTVRGLVPSHPIPVLLFQCDGESGPAGMITLRALNTSGCDSIVTASITINRHLYLSSMARLLSAQYETVTYSLQTASANT